MGLLDWLTGGRYETAIDAALAAPVDPSTLPIATPWGSSTLQRVVAQDVFGTDVPINSRESAMRIPAVARARNLMVTSIARNPLVAMRVDQRLEVQPSWLSSAGGGQSPQHRMAWTVDDLMFYGWSCWARVNNADTFPGNVQRVAMGDWSVNQDNRVEINGVEVDSRSVILIPGLHEGILSYGVEALRDIRTLYAGVRKRLKNPIPGIDLHQTSGTQLTDEQIDKLIERWALAREGENGAVGYTSANIEAKPMSGGDDGSLMIDARNAAAVDVARMIGVSAGLIDATTPKASLNYETKTGRNEEFVDRDLDLYMLPIAARLSLDDVTPHGTRIAFDTSAFTGPFSPTGPASED